VRSGGKVTGRAASITLFTMRIQTETTKTVFYLEKKTREIDYDVFEILVSTRKKIWNNIYSIVLATSCGMTTRETCHVMADTF